VGVSVHSEPIKFRGNIDIARKVVYNMRSGEYIWYIECHICNNFDQVFEVCKKSFIKPSCDKNGMCKKFKEWKGKNEQSFKWNRSIKFY
jgi:hypothetical protein